MAEQYRKIDIVDTQKSIQIRNSRDIEAIFFYSKTRKSLPNMCSWYFPNPTAKQYKTKGINDKTKQEDES